MNCISSTSLHFFSVCFSIYQSQALFYFVYLSIELFILFIYRKLLYFLKFDSERIFKNAT